MARLPVTSARGSERGGRATRRSTEGKLELARFMQGAASSEDPQSGLPQQHGGLGADTPGNLSCSAALGLAGRPAQKKRMPSAAAGLLLWVRRSRAR